MQPAVRSVDVRDVRLQFTELGTGTPVLLCHGFPGLGYSWRHQLPAIAAAGYRAVALDMLGYGGSSAPADPARYTHAEITADLVALLDALDEPRAIIAGQDFGAPAAWNAVVRAPDRFAALVLLSVPYEPHRLPMQPSQLYARVAREHFLHTHYFQQAGIADAELAADPRGFLTRLMYALSGAYRYLDIWQHPSGGNGYLDVLPHAPPLPWPWLTAGEVDQYVDVFRRTGFTGGLNWYRALDANWADEAFTEREVDVPMLFIAGSNEPVLKFLGDQSIDTMRRFTTDLRGVHLLDGAGHWVQQERPDEVNRLLVDFLATL